MALFGKKPNALDIRWKKSMARTVPEWIGKTGDTAIPPRVKARILIKYDGKCYLTGVKLSAKDTDFDHIVALCNGGENRESNIAPIWRVKHKEKTKADVAQKAKTERVRKKHMGLIPKPKGPMMNGRPIKKKMDGSVVYKDTGEPV